MDEYLSQHIGRTILKYRKFNGISQETLAENSNLTAAYVGEIERGKKNPTVFTLNRIAKALNIPIAELFVNLETPNTSTSPELLRFYEYMKSFSPEDIERFHGIIKNIQSTFDKNDS